MTDKGHRINLLIKLQVHNTAKMVKMAIEKKMF